VDDIAVMSLSGKFLAGSDGPFLRKKMNDLVEAGAKKLLIDFAEVPYIDSTGLGFLAGAREQAQKADLRLVLSSLNQHVKKILDEVRLTPFFVIAKDESSGWAKLAKMTSSISALEAGEGRASKPRKGSAAALDKAAE
jgi:anti-sigma B factor antagonist